MQIKEVRVRSTTSAYQNYYLLLVVPGTDLLLIPGTGSLASLAVW